MSQFFTAAQKKAANRAPRDTANVPLLVFDVGIHPDLEGHNPPLSSDELQLTIGTRGDHQRWAVALTPVNDAAKKAAPHGLLSARDRWGLRDHLNASTVDVYKGPKSALKPTIQHLLTKGWTMEVDGSHWKLTLQRPLSPPPGISGMNPKPTAE